MNDLRSFEEFVGLGVMNNIPDATTVAFFRERLRKAGVIEELFEMFEAYLLPGSPGPRRPDHRCDSCPGFETTQYPRGEQRNQSWEAN